ncbi:MAG: tRNA lysidine(34) synthetase TilS, partial [Elusimicrobiota bacterium]
KKITRQFDVNLFIAHIKVKKMKSGPEASARNLRYIALMSIAADNEYNKIATAHTSSDVAETVLLNLIRSPGIEGIFGIPSIREMKDTKTGIKISIIRPLLTISRDEVMCYLTENKLEYATDTSNYDTRFTRNYIRHKIIPLFEKINPGISSNLSNLSQWAVEARKCLSEKTKKIISGIARKTREGIRIDLSKFLKYNYNSKLRILDLILRDFFSVPSINQINAVNKIASEIKGKKLLKLNNSVVLEKSNDFLILKKKNGKNKTVQRD